MQITQHLKSASLQLENISDSARLDAEILLAHSLQKSRTWLATWPDKTLSETQYQNFNTLLKRRVSGEPIAHITGSREFWSLNLSVNKDTLIPRPETELMIEYILEHYPQSANIKLLDLGTGSGAIALALAAERPQWEITATDKSAAALNVARNNAQQLNLSRINFIEGNWFEPLKNQQFDIIASNPPYIPRSDPHLSQGDVRFEPLSALASGEDGLDDIRLISGHAKPHLKPHGLLIIEHGFDQKTELQGIFKHSGYKSIRQISDLARQPRLTLGINS
jgi:release factor glutamine methyltransferase